MKGGEREFLREKGEPKNVGGRVVEGESKLEGEKRRRKRKEGRKCRIGGSQKR